MGSCLSFFSKSLIFILRPPEPPPFSTGVSLPPLSQTDQGSTWPRATAQAWALWFLLSFNVLKDQEGSPRPLWMQRTQGQVQSRANESPGRPEDQAPHDNLKDLLQSRALGAAEGCSGNSLEMWTEMNGFLRDIRSWLLALMSPDNQFQVLLSLCQSLDTSYHRIPLPPLSASKGNTTQP